MSYITNPFAFNQFICRLWGKLFCPRGIHLLDEILTDTEESFFACDSCGVRFHIHYIDDESLAEYIRREIEYGLVTPAPPSTGNPESPEIEF